MDKINYNELFEIEPAPEAEEGAEEQEVAEPAGTEGAKVEEVAEPQSKEENAAFAAARRRAEAESETKIKKAREDADAYVDGIIKDMKLVNPYTQKPITTKAEYEEYKKGYREDTGKSILEKTGMSQQEFDEYVDSIPEVKMAKETATQLREEKAQEGLRREVEKITKLDPDIKSIEDLSQMENFDSFYKLVQRGYSFEDAYLSVNRDKLLSRSNAAAKQAAVNAAKSKEHMTPITSHGAGAVNAPADIRAEYRKLMPGLTDAEIDAHYLRYRKE